MSAQFPPGWGFHATPKNAFDRARAEARAETERRLREQRARERERLASERKAARAAPQAASCRAKKRRAVRQQHLHFALWMRRTIAITGEWPTPHQVHERFDITVAQANAYLRDFDEAIKQEWL